MKFYTSNSTGDSGLFYLGYWINQNFGFPFRVLSADIGIDAEIEILDEQLHSNGLILKAQVKSSQTEITKDFTEYVEKKHLDYWSKLTVPVIYFKIDLFSSKIYYKVISSLDDIELTKSEDEEKWKIDFKIKSDLLTLDSKIEWIKKFQLIEFHNIYSYFEEIDRILNDVVVHVMNDDSYNFQIKKVVKAEKLIEKLVALKNLYPWKYGKKLNRRLENVTKNANEKRNFMNQELQMHNYN